MNIIKNILLCLALPFIYLAFCGWALAMGGVSFELWGRETFDPFALTANIYNAVACLIAGIGMYKVVLRIVRE